MSLSISISITKECGVFHGLLSLSEVYRGAIIITMLSVLIMGHIQALSGCTRENVTIIE